MFRGNLGRDEMGMDGARFLDPLLRSEGETFPTGLCFNSVKFDGIKTEVAELSQIPRTSKVFRLCNQLQAKSFDRSGFL